MTAVPDECVFAKLLTLLKNTNKKNKAGFFPQNVFNYLPEVIPP